MAIMRQSSWLVINPVTICTIYNHCVSPPVRPLAVGENVHNSWFKHILFN